MTDFVIDALAAHRLTQLIVDDAIFDRPRRHIDKSLHEAGYEKARELLRCSWCIGVYVGFGVVTAGRICPRAWRPVARALACADVAGVIARAVREDS